MAALELTLDVGLGLRLGLGLLSGLWATVRHWHWLRR